MTTSQVALKKYTFTITYLSKVKYRNSKQAETCTYSTIQPDANSAVNRLIQKFEKFIIININPEKPITEFETIKVPHQEPEIKNTRIAFPGMRSSEPVVTKKVIKRSDGTKTIITSKRKYTRAEVMEILMRLEVL